MPNIIRVQAGTIVKPTPPASQFYDSGEENTPITGGWVEGVSRDTENLPRGKTGEYIFIRTKAASNTATGAIRTYRTANKVNLASFSKIHIITNYSGGVASYAHFEFAALNADTLAVNGDYSDKAAGITVITGTNTVSGDSRFVNVSALSGSYYIGIKSYKNDVEILKVWGEV